MRLYEILYEGLTPQELLRFPVAYGTKRLNVALDVLPEEAHLYSPEAMHAMQEVVVFSIYRTPLTKNDDVQDLLKLRNSYSYDTHGKDVEGMVDRGVQRMVRRRGVNIDRESRTVPVPNAKLSPLWLAMQGMITDSSVKKTIIPVPSSSPLVGMITNAIVNRVPNATVSDVLYKDDPMFSDAAAKAANPDHDPNSPRTRTVGNVKARIQDMKARIADGDTNPQLQSEMDALQQWVDKQPTFSAKSQYANPRTNRGKWLYGWVKSKPLEAGVPHDVILVDDNIVNGATITTAIKGLMAVNPNIQSIRVLVLHQLRNPKKADPDDYRW